MKNAQYWIDKENRAKKAKAHAEKMDIHWKSSIEGCARESVVYGPDSFNGKIDISVISSDSISAAFAEDYETKRICILNFASYKEPGGMFLKGSKAQEESLCHESFLFNVLEQFQGSYYEWNKKHLNQGLYVNRAIYSPDVMFEHKGKRAVIDVLTCAAPNYSAAFKYQGVSKERNCQPSRQLNYRSCGNM